MLVQNVCLSWTNRDSRGPGAPTSIHPRLGLAQQVSCAGHVAIGRNLWHLIECGKEPCSILPQEGFSIGLPAMFSSAENTRINYCCWARFETFPAAILCSQGCCVEFVWPLLRQGQWSPSSPLLGHRECTTRSTRSFRCHPARL